MTSTTQSASSALERSRTKSGQARQGLAQARGRVDELDVKLGRNAARSSHDEAALQAAQAEVKRLRSALKDASKERQKLLVARKRATTLVAKAEEKAHKAEAKYDRAVLADLIQREKEQDRDAAGTSAGRSASNGAVGAGEPIALPSGRPPALPAGDSTGAEQASGSAGTSSDTKGEGGDSGGAGAQPESLGTATARRTAARSTAKAAGPDAQPAAETPAATAPAGARRSPARRATSGTGRPRTTRRPAGAAAGDDAQATSKTSGQG
jgi:hypothetical protein